MLLLCHQLCSNVYAGKVFMIFLGDLVLPSDFRRRDRRDFNSDSLMTSVQWNVTVILGLLRGKGRASRECVLLYCVDLVLSLELGDISV